MKIQKPVSLMMHEYLSGGRVDGFVGFEGPDEATVVTVVVGATVVVVVVVVATMFDLVFSSSPPQAEKSNISVQQDTNTELFMMTPLVNFSLMS